MHLFLYASSASVNWIMEVFWNVLLLPSESDIYTCFHSPRTYFFFPLPLVFICAHKSIFWWTAQIPAQFSSALGLAALQWARFIEANRYRGQAVADLGVHVMLMKTTVQSLQKDIHLRNNLWTCYRIGNDRFIYCCIYVFGRCIDAFYQSWRSKPWPWDHYASWASWIVKW